MQFVNQKPTKLLLDHEYLTLILIFFLGVLHVPLIVFQARLIVHMAQILALGLDI